MTGIKTNLSLFRRILAQPEFLAGEANTGLLAKMADAHAEIPDSQREEVAAIAAGIFSMLSNAALRTTISSAAEISEPSTWKRTARTEGLR